MMRFSLAKRHGARLAGFVLLGLVTLATPLAASAASPHNNVGMAEYTAVYYHRGYHHRGVAVYGHRHYYRPHYYAHRRYYHGHYYRYHHRY